MSRKGRTIIHVNSHKIRANTKNGTDEPVLTVKLGRSNTYCHEAIIYGADGTEAARVVYDGRQQSCGARVWIETDNRVVTNLRPPLQQQEEQ